MESKASDSSDAILSPSASEQAIAQTAQHWRRMFHLPRTPRKGALEIPVADTRPSVTMLMMFPEIPEAACL